MHRNVRASYLTFPRQVAMRAGRGALADALQRGPRLRGGRKAAPCVPRVPAPWQRWGWSLKEEPGGPDGTGVQEDWEYRDDTTC